MLTDSPLGGSHVNYYSTHEVSSVGMCRHLRYVLTKQSKKKKHCRAPQHFLLKLSGRCLILSLHSHLPKGLNSATMGESQQTEITLNKSICLFA